MLAVGPIAFLAPALLAALVALPLLWWLLRATPPAPTRRLFPGVRLLLGLQDPEHMPDRTPWWLLLLRILAVAAAILGLANPVLNPAEDRLAGQGPLMILMDGGWASAPDWPARQARVRSALDDARRQGRPVILASIAQTDSVAELAPRVADDWRGEIDALEPAAWGPDRARFAELLEDSGLEGVETLWLQDGLGDDGGLSDALLARGSVVAIPPQRLARALRPPRYDGTDVVVDVIRADPGLESRTVAAFGPDPNGIERELGRAEASFAPDEDMAEARFDLPVELRNRVTRMALTGAPSAGGVALTDDGLKRRKVGLIAGTQDAEGLQLLDALHYLRSALTDTADIIEVPLQDLLLASPEVIVLADVGGFADSERAALEEWVDEGGLLVRFAGPRLASSGAGQIEEDPLLPVRLRAGGRAVGGAMSWGAPKRLRPFPDASPFAGLIAPSEVEVTSQVMAQPDPNLSERTFAALEDGTPLVTGRTEGQGRVVLFHVTANAAWSNLPLSGLFVSMLERLAISARPGVTEAGELAGVTWAPEKVLDGFGRVREPGLVAGVDGARLEEARPGPDAPPGLYRAGDRTVAVNLMEADSVLVQSPPPAAGIIRGDLTPAEEVSYQPLLLTIAVALLCVDILATLFLVGRLKVSRPGVAAAMALALLTAPLPQPASAQTPDDIALFATGETVLGYVVTGDAQVDRISGAGLEGLAQVLTLRTAVEPLVRGVDLEADELSFYPMLYWPVTESQATPSAEAFAKLNTFLRNGGMLFFDTRDGNIGGFGSGTPNERVLRRLASGLDLPPLEPVPEDHVITRTFYLLQSFPGRSSGSPLWVEAARDPQALDGVPFRDLNDGVSPVVIGAHDWAGAWAIDEAGRYLLPVGRGTTGSRQREIAQRFGVNLVMYVMTGNYKSDQVHVPALLERLGQ